MNLSGIVSVSFEMSRNHDLKLPGFKVRPGKSAWVQKHFANIRGESVSVPHPEMMEFVPPEKEPFQTEKREQMISLGNPLGHPHVIGIFCLKQKLAKTMRKRC